MIDYVSALSIDFGLIVPEITVLVTSFVVMMLACSKKVSSWSSTVTLVGYVLALWFTTRQWGHQGSGFADMVTCDNFGIVFKAIFIVASIIVVFLGHRYLRVKGLHRGEYYALMLVSTLGMMVMANSSDLIVLFLGLEIMSVPLYVMAGMYRRSLESNEAGIKYFFMGAFSTAFLLLGIAFIFGASGTTNLRSIVTDFSYIANSFPVYLYAGVALILIGFGFKVGTVPFHTWVPDVYQGAPTPVTAFFSVAPKAAGFAALLRVFVYGFSEVTILSDVFWVLAVLTMTVGNLLALRQDNVKRMLAYSSISHAGYILVALVVGGADAVAAAIFYLVAYTMFNLGGFGVVTLLETRSGCKSEFNELRGLSKTNPYLTATLALFMFALSGFPPTVGFIGKFYIFSAAMQSGFVWLTVIGVMNSFVSVYYYLRVIKTSFFDEAEGTPVPAVLSPTIIIALVITAVGTLGLGLFPQQLLQLSQAAIFGMP
ncbi:MAG: NADH-quinone oxidoreductase subunit N [candidate division Zixibacteria bacterium]|nr:NADH-quinone oxidoreductase subunit N [candidate division Zixibacteria bacterium]